MLGKRNSPRSLTTMPSQHWLTFLPAISSVLLPPLLWGRARPVASPPPPPLTPKANGRVLGGILIPPFSPPFPASTSIGFASDSSVTPGWKVEGDWLRPRL